jgi:hypothetical protein
MFGYYLNNKLFRLTEVLNTLKVVEVSSTFEKFEHLCQDSLFNVTKTPGDAWRILHETLSALLEILVQRVGGVSPPAD